MKQTATLLCSALITATTFAQNWVVDVPVDMLLYTQPFYGGCTPGPDYTFTMPASPVSGVQYKVVITAMDPETGSLSISPGLDNGLLHDELVFDAAVERTVTFAAGTTSATLEFRAQGIPTEAGQPHPCGPSAFWMSNLMFCPEGLTPNFDAGCTVQSDATLITDITASGPTIGLPTALNGQHLSIGLPTHGTAQVFIIDASGRMVCSRVLSNGGAIDLSGLTDGAYMLRLVRSTGGVLTKRFLMSSR